MNAKSLLLLFTVICGKHGVSSQPSTYIIRSNSPTRTSYRQRLRKKNHRIPQSPTTIMTAARATSEKPIESSSSRDEIRSVELSIETSPSTSASCGASQQDTTSSPTEARIFVRSAAPSPATIEDRMAWQMKQGVASSSCKGR
jgi:hypothetical protein